VASPPSTRLAAMMKARRSIRSASAPPTGDSTPMGRKAATATRAAQMAWSVAATTRAPTATVSIHVPTLETRPPAKSSAKSR